MKTAENIKARINEINGEMVAVFESAQETITPIVRGILGEEYQCKLTIGRLYVSFQAGVFKNGEPMFCEITFSYGQPIIGDGFVFETNVSAMGGFSLDDDSTREYKYYMAIGKLLASKNELQAIKSILKDVDARIEAFRDEKSDLRRAYKELEK